MPAIIIAGAPLGLSPDALNWTSLDEKMRHAWGGDPMCISSLFGGRISSVGWLLGALWMKTWYTVFWWDAATMGSEVGEGTAVSFAKAVH